MKKHIKKIGLSLLILLLISLPLIVKSQYVISLMITLFIYVVLAESWNLLGGYTGQVSLGHAAFFGMGALATRLLWLNKVPFLLSLPLGGLAAALLATIVGIPCFRMRLAYFPIGTLALGMIGILTVSNIFTNAGALPTPLLKSYEIFSRYYLALFIALLAIIVIHYLLRSRPGLAIVAIRDNEKAAAAIGIKTLKYKTLALLISTFLAGLAGGLYAYKHVSYYYDAPFDLSWSFTPALATFVGGISTIAGPIVGSICFLALSEIFAVTLGQVHVLIFGLCFILIVLFLPGGLLSIKGGGHVRRPGFRGEKGRGSGEKGCAEKGESEA
jgi:branched-chain amino acid transport system permease protein